MNPNIDRPLTTLILISLLASAPAVAALPPHWNTIGPYMSLHLQGGSAEESILEVYLSGVGDGFLTANAMLSNSGQAPLFCPPEIQLNGKNYRSMLDEELRDKSRTPWSTLSEALLSIPLLQALQNKFPCGKK